jgi:hypothetical protein
VEAYYPFMNLWSLVLKDDFAGGQPSFKQTPETFLIASDFRHACFSEGKAGLQIRRLAHIACLAVKQGSGLQMV